MLRAVNPFTVTRAVDLTDEEIQSLWVDVANGDGGGDAILRPTSPLPMFLLGGKGSGKTHWMRYHSYPLQKLRHQKASSSDIDGIIRDGYVGIYVLLSGLNAERFRDRGQSADLWKEIFAYYFELWIAQELLHIISSLAEDSKRLREVEEQICKEIAELVDSELGDNLNTFRAIQSWCAKNQKKLDSTINNVIFTREVDVRVKVTSGALIFGIPEILNRLIPNFQRVMFLYQLDEFENISEQQQKHINSLIRERRPPSTFRVGGRLWSIKTQKTFSDDEENREGSEFETKKLDERLRESSSKWKEFAYALIERRLQVSKTSGAAAINDQELEGLFEEVDLSWKSTYLFERIGSPDVGQGSHFARLRDRLEKGLRGETAPGVNEQANIDQIIRRLSAHGYPLLEKLNILLLFQGWYRQVLLPNLAQEIEGQCTRFKNNPTATSEYATALQHYGSDLLAQLLRDANKQQNLYQGIKTFVQMSEGLPRSLIVILKQIFDWAIYTSKGGKIGKISLVDQERGLLEASDWFMETMRKSGAQGGAVRAGVERLAQLFETNRFSDKPIECSLLGFSVRERDLNDQTKSRLLDAEQRSFLIRVSKLEIDRNTGERTTKFQLNPLLAPKWSLPVARRGIVRFKPEEVDLIFSPEQEAGFKTLLSGWREKMTAPKFGRQKRNGAVNAPDLFTE